MRSLCVCVCACLLALLPASCDAQAPKLDATRCSTDATGDLVGNGVRLKDVVLKPGKKLYSQNLSPPIGCEVNGVSARACDVFAPEVDVAEDSSQVVVRRLGPRSLPIKIAITYYCEPLQDY